MVFITVVESVYCAVRTDSLYTADYVSSLKGETQICPYAYLKKRRCRATK